MLKIKIIKDLYGIFLNQQAKKDTILYKNIIDIVRDSNQFNIISDYNSGLDEQGVVDLIAERTGVVIPVSMFKRYVIHIIANGDDYVKTDKPNFYISSNLFKSINKYTLVSNNGETGLWFNSSIVKLRAKDIASDVIAYYMGIYLDDMVCINRRDASGIELITNHGYITVPKESIYSARLALRDIGDRYRSDYFGEAFKRFCISE